MAPHLVAGLVIIKNRIVIFDAPGVNFAVIPFNDHGEQNILLPVIIAVTSASFASFFLNSFVDDYTVPGRASSAKALGQGNGEKHPADAQADKERLGIIHFRTGFAIDIKTHYDSQRQD
ncbi:MAG: hypothetical protein BWY65_02409 [Firmicutes bacterium ADurb.Bin373]|nr:MAG: hypothetical protein BWY65_02409 [Firmicutes bacterium ADurb.Bin373]